MRARPTRGPITAPAIQALLEDFFLGVVVEMSVAVAVSAPPSLSVVLAAAVAEPRRVEDPGYC